MAASTKKVMIKKMSRMGVVSTGVNLGAIYAILGLLYAVILAAMIAVGGMLPSDYDEDPMGIAEIGVVSAIMLVAMPIIFAIMGFASGAMFAIAYNFVAKYTGGMLFEMTD